MQGGFEIIEEYVKHGMRRFKVRVKGTNLVLDLHADNAEEALKRAEEMARRIMRL
ncbi:MAG: hypothetical protein QXS85_00605 [Acidilobaceae archaeon]